MSLVVITRPYCPNCMCQNCRDIREYNRTGKDPKMERSLKEHSKKLKKMIEDAFKED